MKSLDCSHNISFYQYDNLFLIFRIKINKIMAKKNSEEIDFQHYVDAVKHKKIPWDIFIDLLQDISFIDVNRLRHLNATLLNELTYNCSNIDKLKYLNGILLTEFKKHIQGVNDLEISEIEQLKNLQESNVLNEEKNQEISATEWDSEIPIMNEIKDNFSSPSTDDEGLIECDQSETNAAIFKNDIHVEDDFEMTENEQQLEDSQESTFFNEKINQDLPATELESEIDEIQDNFTSSINEEIIEYDSNSANSKIFVCNICNIEYKISFHLKQHIRNFHEGKKSFNFQLNTKVDGQKFSANKTDKSISNSKSKNNKNYEQHIHSVNEDPKNYKCENCGKSVTTARYLKLHIHTIHEGHRDHKCKSCDKSFYQAPHLRKHIHTIHEGHKDHKCPSCSKSFSKAGCLKTHIHTVHEGHKDFKCESCGKSFSHAHNLRKHIHTVHEGNKDHKCKSCGKAFTRISNLKAHTHRVHSYHKEFPSNPKIDHKANKKEADMIKSKVESQEKTNKIKQEALELEDEMPIFESDSTYLNNEIKQEIVAQSIVDFRYDIKREESTLDDMPNFEMDSTYLDKTIKEEIKLGEPLLLDKSKNVILFSNNNTNQTDANGIPEAIPTEAIFDKSNKQENLNPEPVLKK